MHITKLCVWLQLLSKLSIDFTFYWWMIERHTDAIKHIETFLTTGPKWQRQFNLKLSSHCRIKSIKKVRVCSVWILIYRNIFNFVIGVTLDENPQFIRMNDGFLWRIIEQNNYEEYTLTKPSTVFEIMSSDKYGFKNR